MARVSRRGIDRIGRDLDVVHGDDGFGKAPGKIVP